MRRGAAGGGGRGEYTNIKYMISVENVLFILFVIFFFGCAWYYYKDEFELKCIVAGENGNTYCVRDRKNSKEYVQLLDEATQRMKKLVEHMNNKFPENPAVRRLVAGFNPEKISETLPNSTLVAYTENKSKMSFCLTEKKNGTKIIDINTLMFVAIHELSHISSKSIGHKTEFWDNFKFLLKHATEIGIYTPVDYKKENREYCDMKIRDNPIYDYKSGGRGGEASKH
jgi:hypothetical protein